MLNDTASAPSQPAPPAQPSDAGKPNGAENVGMAEYARQFLKKPVAAETAPPPAAEPITTGQTAPVVAPETAPVPAESPETATQPAPEDSDEALSQSTSHQALPPHVQEAVEKRIAKITAKRRDAERRAEHAEALIAQMAKANSVQPPAQAPETAPVSAEMPSQTLPKINTIAELQKLHKEASEAVRFAEYNLDRDDVVERVIADTGETVKGVVVGQQFYTKAQLRDIKYNAQTVRDSEIPQRANFIASREQANTQAFQLYPWLKDTATPEYQTALAAFREQPWLGNMPNSLLLVGRMVTGLKVEQESARGKAAPATPVKPATRLRPSGDQIAVSSADTGLSRVPLGTQVKAAMAQEDAKLAAKGNATAADYAASLTRKRQLRNTS